MVDPGYEINDGVPHMTYQRPGVDVNFVWDGVLGHPICVCPGGYAEPPAFLIEISTYHPLSGVKTPQSVLWWFMETCEDWLNDPRNQLRVSFM